jgi:hypothetical protein
MTITGDRHPNPQPLQFASLPRADAIRLSDLDVNESDKWSAESLAADLRQMADIIEATPQHAHIWRQMFGRPSGWQFDKTRFLAWSRDMVHYLTREMNGIIRGITRTYGDSVATASVYGYVNGIRVELFTDRGAICTAVVVGKKPVEVIDPDAPKIVRMVDDIEWQCDSRILEVTEEQ